ncbi:Putative B3 domain-containing protein At5g58280 [Linum perenne]
MGFTPCFFHSSNLLHFINHVDQLCTFWHCSQIWGVLQQRQPKPRSKPAAALDEFQPRRSSRARNLIVSYVDDLLVKFIMELNCLVAYFVSVYFSYIARPLDEVRLASFEERERARKAAECFEETLPSCHPVFVKSMVRSHVYSCFWLGLPSQFCNNYLPKRDSDIILEDENGSTYDTKYLSERAGLSGGWRGFALERKLNDGDALVFQLVEPERFKVCTRLLLPPWPLPLTAIAKKCNTLGRVSKLYITT